jgi:cell division septal protein FtsQ
MAWMGSVHIDQKAMSPEDEKPRPKRPEPTPAEKAEREAKKRAVLPMKIFTVLVAIGLALSTIVGVMIALSIRSMRTVSLVLLAAGSIVPILLLK